MRIIPLEQAPFQCGYFDDRDATYEHYLIWDLEDAERQVLLEMGYRSFGRYFFRPACRGCQRCVPIRVPIASFRPSKSQRRVLNKSRHVQVVVEPPVYRPEKLALYQEHGKRFPKKEQAYSEEDFRLSFYDPEVPSLEFCYYVEDRLAGVGIVNETETTLSSVYFFYGQDFAHLSLGTFGVLKEIDYASRNGKNYLYLGYYIYLNRFMRYKADFRPSEVLSPNGAWRPFRLADGTFYGEAEAAFAPFPTPLSKFKINGGARNREQDRS